MSSLKTYFPRLAQILGTTTGTLYERQRLLVDAELLEQTEGRGPGSGVRLTPHTVSILLIAMLSTDSLSETIERTKAVANAVAKSGQCFVTKKKKFVDALAAVFSSKDVYMRASGVTVSRTSASATLRGKISPTRFRGAPGKLEGPSIAASLSKSTLRKIAADVVALVNASGGSDGSPTTGALSGRKHKSAGLSRPKQKTIRNHEKR